MEQLNNQVIKTADWFVTLLVAAIPLVGFIMLFVWAFSGGTNPNKANWAKATLLWIVVIIAFYILIALIFGAALFSVFR